MLLGEEQAEFQIALMLSNWSPNDGTLTYEERLAGKKEKLVMIPFHFLHSFIGSQYNLDWSGTDHPSIRLLGATIACVCHCS